MGGQFTEVDPQRCAHYAQFMKDLGRNDFDGMFWVFFLTVICILFLASWIYQWTMLYKEKADYDEATFRIKLKTAMFFCTVLFLVAAAMLVVEVYALLALQFCDGEDLMSLYWSTWTMMQLGSEIAILGIVLALWHHLCDVRHPVWALALGTPVLVVAGFGHVLTLSIEAVYRKLKSRRRASGATSPAATDANLDCPTEAEEEAQGDVEKQLASRISSAGTTLDLEAGPRSRIQSLVFDDDDKDERDETDEPRPLTLFDGESFVLEIDVGKNRDVVRQWPSFLVLNSASGKAFIQAKVRRTPATAMATATATTATTCLADYYDVEAEAGTGDGSRRAASPSRPN